MVIESRTIVGGAAAFALVGAIMWLSSSLFTPSAHQGSVEVTQLDERAWAVEIKELGNDTAAETRTAAR
jgi:CheY-specific phosphatase CheX